MPIQRKRMPLIDVLVLLTVSALAGDGRAAVAAALPWEGSPVASWHAPLAIGGGVASGTTRYGATGFFVDQGGRYTIDAAFTAETFPTTLYLYTGAFDPTHPQAGLIAISQTASNPRLQVGLAEGAIYYLVTGATGDPGVASFRNTVSGPGHASLDECYPIDEVSFSSAASDLTCQGLLGQDFGVSVTSAGTAGKAIRRTRGEATFRFAATGPADLQVRVYDRCSTSGFISVFIFSATGLPYTVSVHSGRPFAVVDREYTSAGGVPGRPIIDRQAFACH